MSLGRPDSTVLCPQGHLNAGQHGFCAVCGAPIGVLDWPADDVDQVDPAPSRRRLAAVSATVIAVLIVVGIGAFVAFAPLSQDSAVTPRGDSFTSGAPSAVPTGAAICPAAPTIQVESMAMRPAGLTVHAIFLSPCPGEPVEADAELRITVADGQRDIAAGLFDFGTYPLALKPGVPTHRTLIFPPGMYWRTTDMVSETPTVTAHRGGSVLAGVVEPKTSGFDMLLASAPAAPEHGSVEGVAQVVLRELHAADHQYAQLNLADRWVPQIRSQKAGVPVNGVTLTADDVLQDHLALRQRFVDARLIWSGHWTTFDSADWWVTVVGPPRRSAAEANRWCGTRGFGVDDCFAKFISSAAGADGTTVYRN